jgi:peptidoglycan/xylan/chitin deacetylase (PgdA/CDA1 family)
MTFPLKYPLFLLSTFLLLGTGCISNTQKEKKTISEVTHANKSPTLKKNRKPVPILCYHAIRNIHKDDTANQKTYSVSPANFTAQIKALADNGFTSITPDQLKDYWTKGTALPDKPIMITFDDGRKEQYSIGAKILERYHFSGVFFIMTVTIGKPRYMSRSDIKTLSDNGHVIGCHTWDHHKVTDYKKEDWKIQLYNSKKRLEKITLRPVTCFAYPYGVWTPPTADSLKANGYTTAFIVYGKQDLNKPLYTVTRTIVKNTAISKNFLNAIEKL